MNIVLFLAVLIAGIAIGYAFRAWIGEEINDLRMAVYKANPTEALVRFEDRLVSIEQALAAKANALMGDRSKAATGSGSIAGQAGTTANKSASK